MSENLKIAVFPKRALPLPYHQIASSGKGEDETVVGLAIGFHTLYYFQQGRIAAVKVEDVLNALGPQVDAAIAAALEKEGGAS